MNVEIPLVFHEHLLAMLSSIELVLFPNAKQITNDEDSYDMPPSPQPLTIISEENLKKSPKTVLMEALLQKTTDNLSSETTSNSNNNNKNNNNDENCNNKNLNDNVTNSIKTGGSGRAPKSAAKAYAHALNALTGPGTRS